jgi:RsiW-degrading membrane proteinase PrsW (M82 family)
MSPGQVVLPPAPPGAPVPFGQRLKVVAGLADPGSSRAVTVLRILAVALLPIGAVVIFGVLIFLSEFSFGLFTVSALLALLPVPFLVFWFIWLDRFDPAWWEYQAFAFGWGACVATSISLGVNMLGALLFGLADVPEVWVAVWVAPVIEEITKGLAPLLLFLLWRREVVGLADAVMYAGLSATGFAMTENILYLGRVYVSGEQLQGPLGAVVGVATLIVVRLGLTGFIHPLFTSMTGIGIGMAATTRSALRRWLYPLIGLVLAMALHGVWNFTAILAQRNQDASFLGYLYFMVTLPVLFGFVVLTVWARSAPGRALRQVLPEYVRAGWLSPPELGMLVTLRRRLWARRWAKEVAGREGAWAMRAYQVACTRLALLREGRLRGADGWQSVDPEHQLLEEIMTCRKTFTGRDFTVPAAWWDGERYLVTYPDGQRRPVTPQQPFAMPVPVRPWYPWHMPQYALAGPSSPWNPPPPAWYPSAPGFGSAGRPYPRHAVPPAGYQMSPGGYPATGNPAPPPGVPWQAPGVPWHSPGPTPPAGQLWPAPGGGPGPVSPWQAPPGQWSSGTSSGGPGSDMAPDRQPDDSTIPRDGVTPPGREGSGA